MNDNETDIICKMIINSLSDNKITIKESIYENLIIHLIADLKFTYDHIKFYILYYSSFMTTRIIERVCEEFNKQNQSDSIYKILSLCKQNTFKFSYKTLQLKKEILKQLFDSLILKN